MKAFSLIEILISVTIASLVFGAMFTLLVQGLASAQDTRDRFIAANLAQEGIELAVNFRSNNWALCPDAFNLDNTLTMWRGQGSCPSNGNPTISLADGSYITQYDSSGLTAATASNQNLVRTSTGLYCHPSAQGCSGSPTPFSRLISISTINVHQMKVVSLVSWIFNSQPKSVSVEDRLYNWR